jgi:protein phosphatase
LAVRCFAVTEQGLGRPSNQDAAYVRAAPGAEVLAVADGMGGAPAGDRASALVIAAFERAPGAAEPPEGYLRDAVERARRAIEGELALHPERAGMGSTVVAALVRSGEAWIAHVGDSRAYLWRDGYLRPLTEDHSAAAEAARGGRLDPLAARASPLRHVLTRAVGGADSEADVSAPLTRDGNSALLLVSDGVCGVLDDEQMGAVLAAHRGPEAARALVERVHAAGAPDNIGIALLDERA